MEQIGWKQITILLLIGDIGLCYLPVLRSLASILASASKESSLDFSQVSLDKQKGHRVLYPTALALDWKFGRFSENFKERGYVVAFHQA